MSVIFEFKFDDIYFDACRRCLVFLDQGVEVMASKDITIDYATKILEESSIRIIIDRLERVKKSTNKISEILDELLKLHKEGGSFSDSRYQLKKLNESLEVFAKECDVLLTTGDKLADKIA